MNRRLIAALSLVVVFPGPEPVSADGKGNAVEAKRPIPFAYSQLSAAELVDDLEHYRFASRVFATRELSRRGEAVLPQLLDAVENGRPETVARSTTVLQKIYSNEQTDLAVVEKMETRFAKIRKSKNSNAAQHLAALLDRNGALREERALARIRELGGIVDYSDARSRQFQEIENESRVNFILLGRKWRGGDDGLKYIKRISGLEQLYVARGRKFEPVSPEALQELQREMPGMEVQPRGLACLGVSGAAQGNGFNGCYVQFVKPGSAADKGDLKTADLIVQFGGKPVDSFETLVKLIADRDPGETVEIRVLRSGRPAKLNVKLQAWSK